MFAFASDRSAHGTRPTNGIRSSKFTVHRRRRRVDRDETRARFDPLRRRSSASRSLYRHHLPSNLFRNKLLQRQTGGRRNTPDSVRQITSGLTARQNLFPLLGNVSRCRSRDATTYVTVILPSSFTLPPESRRLVILAQLHPPRTTTTHVSYVERKFSTRRKRV